MEGEGRLHLLKLPGRTGRGRKWEGWERTDVGEGRGRGCGGFDLRREEEQKRGEKREEKREGREEQKDGRGKGRKNEKRRKNENATRDVPERAELLFPPAPAPAPTPTHPKELSLLLVRARLSGSGGYSRRRSGGGRTWMQFGELWSVVEGLGLKERLGRCAVVVCAEEDVGKNSESGPKRNAGM
ncbi:hypothetical protein B0H11DRAFT_1912774 [Mycena galericulata]|nr:hypothetical protein B0H11DRAFT_1912774 [Mycena galericulata]